MPRILHKLRIDEISSVDAGAGDGTRVVLWKRDAPRREKPSFYYEIFARKDEVRKSPRYRGVSGRKIHLVENLTREEAKQFLLHDPHGRALLRDTGGDIDALADHLVEASKRTTNKRKEEVPKMDDRRMIKNVRMMGEHEYTKVIANYARKQYPELSKERAFTKVFTEDSPEGVAIRELWLLSKQGPVSKPPVADRDEEDEQRERSEDLRDERDSDERDDDEDDTDALKELERLAEQEQRRNAGMSKAVAFTKVYSDPANAALAQRERRQNRPRA